MTRRIAALLVLTGAVAAACDYPTEPPMWEQNWQVPGETIELSVAELLPAGVSLNADSTAFVVEAAGASVVFSLGDMCGTECQLADGLVAPKPAFGDTLTTTSALPSELIAATLSGGEFAVTLAHDLSFDPLRPSSDTGAERGQIGITVTSSGNVVADTVVHGDQQPFPAGSPLTITIGIRPVEVASELEIELWIYSPAGDATEIDTSETLSIVFDPSPIEIAEATVAAGAITLEPTTTEFDLALEEYGVVLDRIRSGALLFEVRNPFAVSGGLSLEFDYTTGSIQRSLTIAEGEYSARIEFTGRELRDILGSESGTVSTSGLVSAPSGTITVTPTQQLVLESDLEVVVLVGGQEGDA